MTISASASPKDSTSLTAIIVAAGGGARMGGGLEKQFRDFGGRPVLAYSVDAFLRHTATRRVVVVVAEGRRRAAQEALGQLAGDDRVEITTGGDRRQDSVRAGLAAADSEAGLVAIHDAARPLLSQQMISTLVHAMTDDVQAALPVLPVVDTLKTLAGTRVESTTSRTNLGRAQTPQIFRRDHLLALYGAHDPAAEITDDIQLVETDGGQVAAVPGDERLWKLTTPRDFDILAALAGDGEMFMTSHSPAPDIRTGSGFDVHKFGDGPGPLMLAGVAVPHDRGLAAHSDGDVGLHALCDAIFGALADGDIGSHFPPSDARWKDAESGQFLAFAAERCAARGATILNLDLTLICEQPKIGPHRDAMRARIAALAAIDLERVAVKATTSEGLGFTGRGEGIAAQAAATLLFGAAT
ncbi:MAG: 2-C-methyl-D-erythritol 4-phosphate cytidylyltransferase [Pseudomonadota bacterium]|nr:2-C-methyl-D-erythritol 4-phosphate cytidylyltransferase [Pseudomonadota bacterium]